ncbi:MAG: DUF5721 family protein [Lachnospiraceae bacterium]|nr:DUF5721 family protein [Lachnospiraceae bacterium]
MLALNILDIPRLMSALLTGSLFDEFTLTEASITTFYTMTIDGRLEKSFFSGEEEQQTENTEAAVKTEPEYVRWKDVKPRCFEMIKGKRIPLFFRFVFYLPKEKLDDFWKCSGLRADPALVSGLCLNLRFNGQTLVATTGTSLKTFTPDRSIDNAWDDYVKRFLKEASITAEEV